MIDHLTIPREEKWQKSRLWLSEWTTLSLILLFACLKHNKTTSAAGCGQQRSCFKLWWREKVSKISKWVSSRRPFKNTVGSWFAWWKPGIYMSAEFSKIPSPSKRKRCLMAEKVKMMRSRICLASQPRQSEAKLLTNTALYATSNLFWAPIARGIATDITKALKLV